MWHYASMYTSVNKMILFFSIIKTNKTIIETIQGWQETIRTHGAKKEDINNNRQTDKVI